MKAAPPLAPANPDRLAALRRYGVLKHESQASFAWAASLAARSVDASASMVLLVAETSLRIAAASGLDLAGVTRKLPFKLDAVLHDRFIQSSEPARLQILNDLIDPQHPADFAFHAAVPIRTAEGHVLGSLCVLDRAARALEPHQALLLEEIAGHLVGELNLRVELWRASQSAAERVETNQPLLERVVETASQAIVSVTPEGIVTSWNAAAEGLFGYTAREALGRNATFLVADADRALHHATLERLIAGERLEPVEARRLHKNGTPLEVRIALSPITGVGGRIIGISGIFENLTSAALARGQQHRLREHLGTLAARLPVTQFALDGEGGIVFVEGQLLELLGAEQSANLSGQSVFDLFARYPNVLATVRRALAGERFSTVLETRSRAFECHLAPDGQGAIGVAMDITPLRQATAQTGLLDAALHRVADGVMVYAVGPDGPHPVYANPRFAAPEGGETDREVLARALAHLADRDQYREEIVDHLGGPEATVVWHVSAVRDSDGRITHLICVQRGAAQAGASAEQGEVLDPDLAGFLGHLAAPGMSSAGNPHLELSHTEVRVGETTPASDLDGAAQGGDAGLQGQLEEVGGAGTLLQMISMIVPSGALALERGVRIYLQAGRIVHAEHPTQSGAEAVMAALSLETGRFQFLAHLQPPKVTLDLDPVTLALEAARTTDEQSAAEDAAPAPNPETTGNRGLIVLPDLRVALDFVAGVGGAAHFQAKLEPNTPWGQNQLVLHGRGLRIVVLSGALEELPASFARALEAQGAD